MKLNAILKESTNTPLIIVDVQPEYDSGAKIVMRNGLVEFVNKHNGPILLFFNGEEVSNDNKDTVLEYWLDYGLDEDRIDDIRWHEKTYGFFRSWMDSDVDVSKIIKVLRLMYQKKVYDSRELDEEILSNLVGDDFYDNFLNDDPLIIPEISIKELREYNNGYICGGGKHECLREITILMNAFNIKYKMLNRFIYG